MRAADCSSTLKYRPDLDGLRAVAVTGVILYHVVPALVHGGLAGVDMFFVLSGYLISTIILKDLSTQRFSFLDFYARRVKRIFPALAAVLVACLIFGWFTLYDVEYEPLGKHVAGGAAFVSNFVLSGESGYFDTQSGYKELLHLWSLGVEEQFYLVFPLLLAWWGARGALPLIGSLLAASFALSVWLVRHDPAEAFYWPFTRFWELMVGAVWAHVSLFFQQERAIPPAFSRLRAEALSWMGVLLLLAALHLIRPNSAIPGWLALFPTGGTLLLIAAGPEASVNRYVLSSKPLVFVGLISYPLYLWHWPILSFERVLFAQDPGLLSRLVAVAATFVLAWATYRAIERPIRRSHRTLRVAGALCGVMLSIGLAGVVIAQQGGLAFRTASSRDDRDHRLLVEARQVDAEIRKHRYETQPCRFPGAENIPRDWCASFGPDDAETVVLWGDSHAGAWSPVFFKIAQRDHLRVVRFFIGGCPPLIGTRRIDRSSSGRECASYGQGERVLEAIRELRPARVFLVARWSLYTPSKIEASARTASHGDSASVLAPQLRATVQALPPESAITIFRTAPVLWNEPERALLHGTHVEKLTQEYRASEADANRAIDAAAAARTGVSVFDPGPILCDRTCSLVAHGTVLYADTNHLSAQGALLAYDALARSYFRTMVAAGN